MKPQAPENNFGHRKGDRMIKHINLLLCGFLIMAGSAWAQEIRVTGTNQSLQDLIDSDSLVTVVLKPSGVEDKNLQVIEIGPDYVVFRTQDGLRTSYLKESIQTVRIQEERLEQRAMQLRQVRALRAEDRKTMERAFERAGTIFETTSDNQVARIKAAALLSVNNDLAAQEYLERLLQSNDLRTQLDAARAQFLAGNGVSWELVRDGLMSGFRPSRALAAMLAGAANMEEAIPILNEMIMDRAADFSAPAARALAHLGQRDIIPRLMTMISELNEEKGDAAVYALSHLGGDDVLNTVKSRLPAATGHERFRLVKVLYTLRDPLGTEEMQTIFQDLPTLAPDAAILLAQRGHWEATQFIRQRLDRREDPTDANLTYRAQYAASLYQGGELISRAILQELLRSESRTARNTTLDLIVEINDRAFFSIIQPAIENIDTMYALKACETAAALGIPQFRERLLMLREN